TDNVFKSFEFRKRQKSKNHDDVGDYDVLFIDVDKKLVWNIECKFIHKVANISEVANQQKGFFEQGTYHTKFQRRINYLENHMSDLFDCLNLNYSNDYKIKNYMVTNKLFEAQNLNIEFDIITYHELEQLIKNPDMIVQ
ncbi:MAG: hypothetical protein LBM93_13895, partial [Oscillospiraceae bacterium]|nr:hypothetical protein [Oscillospiraceae bacterium]